MLRPLAHQYHLIFQDCNVSIERRAGILGPLLEKELAAGKVKVLDAASGQARGADIPWPGRT